MPVEERFSDLPLVTKAFLKTLGDEEIVHLKNLIRFYDTISDKRHEHVVEWLRDARKEDLELLDDGIRLVQSGKTIGKFMWWALATLLAAMLLGSQVGEWFAKALAIFRGGR